ncbi:MAG: hypothetical protein ACE5E8_04930 [Acidimicrobiia bacterium]
MNSKRRSRWIVLLVFFAVLAAARPAAAAPAPVEVTDLIADPETWADPDVEVSVTGELVGDFGRRRDGTVWVQINGDPYVWEPLLDGGELAGANVGVAARIPDELARGLGTAGGYRHRGAVVRITGRWRWHDAGRGGESYIDVRKLEVVAAEQPLQEGPRWIVLGMGWGLLAAAGVVAARRRRRSVG